MTYPSKEVADFINEHFVALRVDVPSHPELVRRYDVFSTPTLIVLDPKGREFYRSVGFLPPDRFVCHLQLGRAIVTFRTRRYAKAGDMFEELAERYPLCGAAPEAIYFRGVARDKVTGDHSNRKVAALELAEGYPESDWALRAGPWLSEEK